jgi:hypothetical protein
MGARSYWCAPLPPLVAADSTAFTGTSPADVVIAPTTNVPPDLLEIGTRVRLWAAGEYTSTSATPTLGIGFYYGGASGGVALANATALPITATATAWPWIMDYQGVIRTTGSSGTIKGVGRLFFGFSLTGYGQTSAVPTIRAIPETQAARTATIDTTTRKALTVGAAWSVATGSPTLTVYDFLAEIVG